MAGPYPKSPEYIETDSEEPPPVQTTSSSHVEMEQPKTPSRSLSDSIPSVPPIISNPSCSTTLSRPRVPLMSTSTISDKPINPSDMTDPLGLRLLNIPITSSVYPALLGGIIPKMNQPPLDVLPQRSIPASQHDNEKKVPKRQKNKRQISSGVLFVISV